MASYRVPNKGAGLPWLQIDKQRKHAGVFTPGTPAARPMSEGRSMAFPSPLMLSNCRRPAAASSVPCVGWARPAATVPGYGGGFFATVPLAELEPAPFTVGLGYNSMATSR